MTFSKDDIIEIMAKAKALGYFHIKMDDFEARSNCYPGVQPVYTSGYNQSIGDVPTNHAVSVFPSTVKDEKFEDLIKPISPFDELTEDEILYWGTAHGDELIAKRKAREEELKNEKLK